MPRYTAKRNRQKQRRQKKVTRGFSRDKRILKRWAISGTDKDYERFRRYADMHAVDAPDFVLPSTMDELAAANRQSMVKNIHAEPHGGGWFMDGLNWLLGKVPKPWSWISGLANAASKPWKGDSMNEIDEEYAKLVDATYKDDRPEMLENWRRMPELDSEYLATWQNADGHVLIAVRGTKLSHLRDIGEDLLVAAIGSPLDVISRDLSTVLNSIPPDKTVDLAAHSLGTSLALTAYEKNPELYGRIHQTFLYSPAFSPFAIKANVTEKYEKDANVRYFISLSDPVSIGDIGSQGPSNVVYRTGNPLKPMTEHNIESWYPGTYDELHTTQHIEPTYSQNDASVGSKTVQPDRDDLGADTAFSFGEDNFNQRFEQQLQPWSVRFNEG